MSDAERWSRSAAYPVGMTAVWALSVAVFFRYWELTLRAPGLLTWVMLYTALYVVTAILRFGPAVREQHGRVWRPVQIWLGVVLVVGLVHLVVPQVRIGNQVMSTSMFVNTLDVLFPCWLMARGVLLLWDATPVRIVLLTIGPVAALAAIFAYMVPMPGRSHEGAPPPLSEEGMQLRVRLRAHVEVLAGGIGERSESAYTGLLASVDYLRAALDSVGFAVRAHEFEFGGQRFQNLEVEVPGRTRPDEIVVVGGHYDTAPDTPGANDNASGTAAVLELARMLREARFDRTVRFVLFPNEEPPFFETEWMGSYQYAARSAARGEHIVAMLSMETIGSFSDEPRSQRYPPLFRWFYPNRGDFIGFVGNLASRSLVHRCIETFRETTPLPSEGVAALAQIPGVGWSDHMSFWKHGYRALMITDTAPFRYDHYHMPTDTPDKLDYDRMTWVVLGVADVVRDLAGVAAARRRSEPGGFAYP